MCDELHDSGNNMHQFQDWPRIPKSWWWLIIGFIIGVTAGVVGAFYLFN